MTARIEMRCVKSGGDYSMDPLPGGPVSYLSRAVLVSEDPDFPGARCTVEGLPVFTVGNTYLVEIGEGW